MPPIKPKRFPVNKIKLENVSWVSEIVHNKNILDSIEDILGPNILCWSSSFFIKHVRCAHVINSLNLSVQLSRLLIL